MRSVCLVVALILATSASADDAPRPEMVQGRMRPGLSVPPTTQPQRADPTQQALVQMLTEAQQREAGALVQAYTLRAQLDEMTKRAEAAEAKAAADKPSAK